MGTLWLVGMMGSGKTTVAQIVAASLNRPCVDTDTAVVASTGRSIDDWFATDVTGFREAERTAVLAVAGDDIVVACGGGVVLDPDAVTAMRSSGLVVWLDAPVAELVTRLGTGSGRPLLDDDPANALERIRGERLDDYRAAAHVVISCSGTPEQVAEAVIAAWTGSS